MIQSKPHLDWNTVTLRARETKGLKILFLGLYLAREVLSAPVPSRIMETIEMEPDVLKVASRIVKRLPDQWHRGTAGLGERFRFHSAMQDTQVAKARYAYVALLRRAADLIL